MTVPVGTLLRTTVDNSTNSVLHQEFPVLLYIYISYLMLLVHRSGHSSTLGLVLYVFQGSLSTFLLYRLYYVNNNIISG